MSEIVAEFIYKTANPIVSELAKKTGEIAYINSLKAKAPIPAWKDKYEGLMTSYKGKKFTFNQLESWVKKGDIQPRYKDITIALYESLKPYYK